MSFWQLRSRLASPLGLLATRWFIVGLSLGLLGLVLFPVFATGHGGSHRINCMSNAKLLGLGVLMYCQDYDDRFPIASLWMDESYPYIKNIQVYHCPELLPARRDEFGYAFNSLLSIKERPKILDPATALLLYDSNELQWNARSPGSITLANPPRHGWCDTICFSDGHAKMFKLFAATESVK